MTEDSLISAAKADNFSSESPLRAFTDFNAAGRWAIGKGFRPSLQHLPVYLDAMERKEGWQLVQIIDGGTLKPTLVFHRERKVSIEVEQPHNHPWTQLAVDAPTVEQYMSRRRADGHPGHTDPDAPIPTERAIGIRSIQSRFVDDPTSPSGFRVEPVYPTTLGVYDVPSDPINPAHYDGRACADIGERLSANGYQILKYVWRLGRRDDPVQELEKDLWYCDSEIALMESFGHPVFFSPATEGLPEGGIEFWFQTRLEGQSDFTKTVARALWVGYNANDLRKIRETVAAEHARRRG